jgi:hypothetical protein
MSIYLDRGTAGTLANYKLGKESNRLQELGLEERKRQFDKQYAIELERVSLDERAQGLAERTQRETQGLAERAQGEIERSALAGEELQADYNKAFHRQANAQYMNAETNAGELKLAVDQDTFKRGAIKYNAVADQIFSTAARVPGANGDPAHDVTLAFANDPTFARQFGDVVFDTPKFRATLFSDPVHRRNLPSEDTKIHAAIVGQGADAAFVPWWENKDGERVFMTKDGKVSAESPDDPGVAFSIPEAVGIFRDTLSGYGITDKALKYQVVEEGINGGTTAVPRDMHPVDMLLAVKDSIAPVGRDANTPFPQYADRSQRRDLIYDRFASLDHSSVPPDRLPNIPLQDYHQRRTLRNKQRNAPSAYATSPRARAAAAADSLAGPEGSAAGFNVITGQKPQGDSEAEAIRSAALRDSQTAIRRGEREAVDEFMRPYKLIEKKAYGDAKGHTVFERMHRAFFNGSDYWKNREEMQFDVMNFIQNNPELAEEITGKPVSTEWGKREFIKVTSALATARANMSGRSAVDEEKARIPDWLNFDIKGHRPASIIMSIKRVLEEGFE